MRPLLILAPLAVGALLTGCGGSGPTASANVASATVASTTPATTAVSGGGRFANLTPEQQQQLATYQQCLAAHGAPNGGRFGGGNGFGPPPSDAAAPPSAATPPPSVDRQALQAAQQACQAQRPAFLGQGGRGNGQFGQALRAYLSCLKDHGVQVPDLGTVPPSGAPATTAPGQAGQAGQAGGRVGAALQQVRSDPKFPAADAVCKVLLPSNGAAGAGPSTPGATTPASTANG